MHRSAKRVLLCGTCAVALATVASVPIEPSSTFGIAWSSAYAANGGDQGDKNGGDHGSGDHGNSDRGPARPHR